LAEGTILKFINPASGEVFGSVPTASPEVIQRAVSDLKSAQKAWGRKSVSERVRILRKFQAVIVDSMDEISNVIGQDTGKNRQDVLIEIFTTLDQLNINLKYAKSWLRKVRVPRGYLFFQRLYSEPRPLGCVAVIAPWNYPFVLSVPPVLAALLAGNTVVLKPSEVSAATGALIESLFEQVPELAPNVRVLHGDGSVGAAIIQNRPDFIFLTGSTDTGKAIMKAASEHLIPITCELGGKDAMIVLDDADIESAARWGVWGSFFNAGQVCMSIERIYVMESVFDQFLEKIVSETRKLNQGYSQRLDSPYHCGPLTDPKQLHIIQRQLQDARDKGAELLLGGSHQGLFFEPTLLTGVDHSMLIMQEETFGPILPIVKVKDEGEAIQLTNDSQYGLSAYIWTSDLRRARRLAQEIQTGSVVVNDTMVQFGAPLLPFGGIKASGFGRIHGKQGLLQFTQAFAYVEGKPPMKYDLATIVRTPGRYKFIAVLIGLIFGVTFRQKVGVVLNRLLH
jgi:acyl-CoA reductase-like NAD-dependent aldehyde dehydrogenase